MTDLGLSTSLMTMVGCPSPLVTGLSSWWYFDSLDHLGILVGSDCTMLEENIAVIDEDLRVENP